MGRLIDGVWQREDLGSDAQGRFVRRASKFRNEVTADGSSGFAGAAGRYHLYVASACGWSHRALIFRQQKGLEDVVSASFVHPYMGDDGWTFDGHVDPVLGKATLSEVYVAARSDYTGRVTVPVLWDRETATIVSNESIDIMRSFNCGFGALGNASVDLFPAERQADIDAMVAANYESVQNGVYKCGFAGAQGPYDEAAQALFTRLDELEILLGKQRYLLGDDITAADWYLFPTLYRFDTIYYIHFKCSLRQLRDYPNLWGYTRDLYQVPGLAGTCNMAETREHYFRSHPTIHPRGYVPIGPVIDFSTPHGRG